MSRQEDELEKLVKAISWKLYLEPHQEEYARNWENFSRDHKDSKFQEKITKVYENLVKISGQMFAERLGLDNFEKQDGIKFLELMWRICIFEKCFSPGHDQQLQEKVREIFRKAIRDALTSLESETQADLPPQNSIPSSQGTPTPADTLWKYQPVLDVVNKHAEFDCKSSNSQDGLKLIGGRVRGKAHKHEGTNCDDWFEFAVSGNWTIIAVSDGAGSKKFSRIGAKVSCQSAVEYLKEKLPNLNIQEREQAENLKSDLNRDKDWAFLGQDIESIQQSLHEAIKRAYQAVEEAAIERQKDPQYKAILNKEIQVNDLSATLLLAVHTTVKAGDKTYSLVLTCQIGDGMIAAISIKGELTLLGKPDSGDYGGQTEFLTSKNQLQKGNLLQKTLVFVGDLKALMLMTDGVADDYFPYDPGMLGLYGDLILNQIIEIDQPEETDLANTLRTTNLGNIQGVENAKDKFKAKIKRIIDPSQINEPTEVSISSVEHYAKVLGKLVSEVVTSPTLLASGILEEQMCNECHQKRPEEKLQLWLDSYYCRASFDDRTLVVLYR